MRVLIRGAGDIATGTALRLCRARLQVVMTDLASPTAIRRTVCFSQAIVYGTTVWRASVLCMPRTAPKRSGSWRREISPCWQTLTVPAAGT